MKFISLAFLTFAAIPLCSRVALADIKWDVDGGVTSGYDDNVTYANTNKIGDMVTRTSLNSGFTQQGKNDQFDLKGGIVENIYTNNSSLDNLAEVLNSDYASDIGQYDHLKAGEIFSHSIDPSSLGNSFGRINGDYGTYYNKLGFDYGHDFTDQWKTDVRYSQTDYIFTTEALSDSSGYNPGASLEYDLSSQSRATLNYDYRERTFSPGGSAVANTPTLAWRQYLTTQLHADLQGGVDFIHGFGISLDKPRYGAGLTHDLDQNTNFTLTYNKQYEADPFTQDINNDWSITLNAFHQFTDKFTGDMAFFGGQGKYVISGTEYKFVGTNINFKYNINEHMDVTLTYTLQDSISKSAIRNSLHNVVYAGVTYKM